MEALKRTFYVMLALCCCLLVLPVPAQDDEDESGGNGGGGDDFDPVAAAGNNIGRTEEDDEYEQEDAGTQLGRFGAVEIPLAIERDCEATIAIYTKSGQLVRILGQMLELEKGEYRVRWDGLDLFGNIVPADAELAVKVITNDPLQAYFEMAVSAPKVAPWGGQYGTKENPRAGGWLGDHSAPGSAVAFGDMVIVGCTVAEAGANMIALNHEGEALWTSKLDGWSGPRQFETDGKHVYALHRRRGQIYRINPVLHEDNKGRMRISKEDFWSAGGDPVQAMAAANGNVYVIQRNSERDVSPFRTAMGNGGIDFRASTPQVLGTKAPTEFHISPQAAFGGTFTSPGNPQNGAGFRRKGNNAYIVLAFKKPEAIGSYVLQRVGNAAKVEVWALKEGVKFDDRTHSPLREGGADDPLMMLDMGELDTNWVKVGETDAQSPLNVVTSSKVFKTSAIYFKAVAKGVAEKDWKVGVSGARLMEPRMQRLGVDAKVTLPPSMVKNERPNAPGWSFRTKYPISHVYPANIVYDLGKPTAMDAVCLLNCVNPRMYVDVFTGDAGEDPAMFADDNSKWREVGVYKGKYNKKLRYLSASKKANEQYVTFDQRETTRALRFRVELGFRGGKWGPNRTNDDNFLAECDDVAIVRLVGDRVVPPSHLYQIVDAKTGKSKFKAYSDDYDLPVIAAGPDGKLYGVVEERLAELTFATSGKGGITHDPINGSEALPDVMSMSVSADRIAVGSRGRNAIVVFDRGGKVQTVIGDLGPRKRGLWDPNVINKPSAVAIDSSGQVWVAEESFAPKRVARYGPDGQFREEYLGPPMYGGGGHLGPDLKSFYYRSMQFALDWDKGTSRLKALNDRLRSEETPVQSQSSFGYTPIGKPFDYRGRRYLVNGTTLVIVEDNVWRPCLVMGDANRNPFLLDKETWNKHWGRFELTDKKFIWCDVNGDGEYQVDEVELFEQEGKHFFGKFTLGPDLSYWGGSRRVKPYKITDKGVPLYRASDFKPFDYSELAPHYPRNYTTSGPRSAKPGYFGFMYVTEDGHMVQEGQPYVVKPDGTILGGPVTTKPSDYIPPIDGVIPRTTWSWTGGAMTSSDVGEIAVVNSMQGYTYVWATKFGLPIGRFFTGETGGWGYGMPVERGYDVTGRKHSWEGWHGDFIKADNGNYYAQGGKTFHAIARIEGLDDYKVHTQPLTFTKQQVALNERLRPVLQSRYSAMKLAGSKSGRKEYAAIEMNKRAPRFKFDGEIEDWGSLDDMQLIDDERNIVFDIAHTEAGVYIAVTGRHHLGNAAEALSSAFRHGFAIDLQWRSDNRQRSRDVVAGDRRLIIAKHDGAWRSVFYDYLNSEARSEETVLFESPVIPTSVSRVVELNDSACRVKMKEDNLAIDIGNLDSIDTLGDAPTMPGAAKTEPDKPKPAPDTKFWTAEIFVPWDTLGVKPGQKVRFDIGVLGADKPGKTVASRNYWSNRSPTPTTDPGIEAMLNPGAWGHVTFMD